MLKESPRARGYPCRAVGAHHGTWISWPDYPNTWPEKLTHAEQCVARWVRALVSGERVEINVSTTCTGSGDGDPARPTRRSMTWGCICGRPRTPGIRDYGPSFVVGPQGLAAICWEFDAWAARASSTTGTAVYSIRVVRYRIESGCAAFTPGIVLEGGSIEVNGEGTLMATWERLSIARPSRPTSRNRSHTVRVAGRGARALAIERPHEGDDTDGHIDNLARFVGPATVLTVVETDRTRPLYEPLQQNLRRLEPCQVQDGKQLTVVTVPLPAPFTTDRPPTAAKPASNSPPATPISTSATASSPSPPTPTPTTPRPFRPRANASPTAPFIGIDRCDYILGQGAIHRSTQQQPSLCYISHW